LVWALAAASGLPRRPRARHLLAPAPRRRAAPARQRAWPGSSPACPAAAPPGYLRLPPRPDNRLTIGGLPPGRRSPQPALPAVRGYPGP